MTEGDVKHSDEDSEGSDFGETEDDDKSDSVVPGLLEVVVVVASFVCSRRLCCVDHCDRSRALLTRSIVHTEVCTVVPGRLSESSNPSTVLETRLLLLLLSNFRLPERGAGACCCSSSVIDNRPIRCGCWTD